MSGKRRPPGGDSRGPEDTRPAGRRSALIVPQGPVALPAHIREHIAVDPVSGCWRWTGRHDRYGYGRLGREGAHRVVYRALIGPIPAGKVVDHLCRVPCCVNPAHLEPVTHRVNVLRGVSFAAVNYAKVKCDNGHPYDLVGTYYRPNGHRDCRVCIRARVKRYKRRQRSRTASREAFGRAA